MTSWWWTQSHARNGSQDGRRQEVRGHFEHGSHQCSHLCLQERISRPKLSDEQCKYFGKKKQRSECSAREKKCLCGILGHFKRYCFSGGKPKKRRDPQERREKKDSEETGNFLEDCINISVKIKLPPLQTLYQSGEAELASLQLCKGSGKWVDIAKDEDENYLHIIIKPELKY